MVTSSNVSPVATRAMCGIRLEVAEYKCRRKVPRVLCAVGGG
jgi:hypothetical protein